MEQYITQHMPGYEFLSKFYRKPFIEDGIEFTCVENYIQYHRLANDVDKEDIIGKNELYSLAIGTICEAREDWDDIKIDVMFKALQLKFKDPVLKQKLLDTKDYIIIYEGSGEVDRFWGIYDKKGANVLGQLLTIVRGMCERGEL